MKHINLFESFEKTEYYYQEITQDEYNPIFNGDNDYITFEDKYSKKLISLGFEQNQNRLKCCHIHIFKPGDGNTPEDVIDVYVYQRQDEYFDVELAHGIPNSTSEYYRCDQIEGLFKLLKDKDII